MGFDQREVIKLRRTETVNGKTQQIGVDIVDLGILSVIADMSNRASIKKVLLKDGQYSWISYNAILEDLPIIDIDRRQLSRRIAKLQSFDLVKCVVERQKGIGTFTYIRVGEAYETITYCTDRQESQGGVHFCHPGSQECTAKDYNTIQENNTREEKEKNAHARENSVAADGGMMVYTRKRANANDSKNNNTPPGQKEPQVPDYLREQWQRWYSHVQTTKRPFTSTESMQLCIDDIDKHCCGDAYIADRVITNAIKHRYDYLVFDNTKDNNQELAIAEQNNAKELIIDGIVYR